MTQLIEVTVQLTITRELDDRYSDAAIEEAATRVENMLKGTTLIHTAVGQKRVGIVNAELIDWDGYLVAPKESRA